MNKLKKPKHEQIESTRNKVWVQNKDKEGKHNWIQWLSLTNQETKQCIK